MALDSSAMIRCIGEQRAYDTCFLCDGGYYQHGEPPFIVSVAHCKHPSWLRANWYYKYPEAEFCDDGFSGGSLLGEIGSVHAAVCVVYTYQATLQSALIVSDCQSLFNDIRNHR